MTKIDCTKAVQVVNESIESVDRLIALLKTTPWPGVENLLENRSARAIKEAEIYLASTVEALQKAKRLLESTDEELLGNAKVVFGLKKQGHIPTIERMLKEGKNWDDIGAAINWCPLTAREHYERVVGERYRENVKLASGLTYGEWADEQLALGNYDCTRDELIQYCHKQQQELKNQCEKPIRKFREQCESMEGGMGSG